MSLNDEVRIVRIGSTGIDGTGITDPEKLQITSDLAELQALVMPPLGVIASGMYYGPMSTLSGGTVAGQYNRNQLANKLFAAPFICPVDATFNQVGLQISVAGAAGATVRMGIYDTGADGLPGALLADLGTADATLTGFRFVAISQVLGRGLYWIAGAASADCQVLADQSPGLTAIGGHYYTDGSGPVTTMQRTTDLTSGFTALPDPFGAITAKIGVPFYWLRAA